MQDHETITGKLLIRPTKRRRPDLTASFVTQENGKSLWTEYFAVWLIKEGYYRGKDKDGNIIVIQTREAKDLLTGRQDILPTTKRRPDLFIHIEAEENGEKLWNEILVAWKSKRGNFLSQNGDGQSIVIQPKEAKDELFKLFQQKQIAPVDLDEENTPEPIGEVELEPIAEDAPEPEMAEEGLDI